MVGDDEEGPVGRGGEPREADAHAEGADHGPYPVPDEGEPHRRRQESGGRHAQDAEEDRADPGGQPRRGQGGARREDRAVGRRVRVGGAAARGAGRRGEPRRGCRGAGHGAGASDRKWLR
ncbi:hypothetical protein BN2537_2283 [Streptomyces venezuelae]|nr:hypothetical protein BN2537_2283 [Streptomyces venezuelae]